MVPRITIWIRWRDSVGIVDPGLIEQSLHDVVDVLDCRDGRLAHGARAIAGLE